MALCPPPAPRLRPAAPPVELPEFPLLEDLELELELSPLDLDMGEEPEAVACPPRAPRLRPSAPPVELCALPCFELPPPAAAPRPCASGSFGSSSPDGDVELFALDEAAADEEEAVFVSPENYLYACPKVLSACSTSTAPSSPRSESFAIDMLFQEQPALIKQLKAPASPPSAPRLRPAAPPIDIFLMPELELPPVAEDAQMGTAEAEDENEVLFVLHGFNDDTLEHCSSDHGSLSPSIFGSSPGSDHHLHMLQPEVSAGKRAACEAKPVFGDGMPLLARASSSCSTRAPSPRKESEDATPGRMIFAPELLLA